MHRGRMINKLVDLITIDGQKKVIISLTLYLTSFQKVVLQIEKASGNDLEGGGDKKCVIS